MHASKSFNKHLENKTMYHAFIESLIADENVMDQGVVDLIKYKKRPHDDDDKYQDPLTRPDQGLKKRTTSKDAEPPKNPKLTGSSKSNTSSQPKSTGKSAALKHDWFKKPQRAPTPDPEWNKGKSVDNEPVQNWLNDLANEEKPPLSIDDLMSTPIDFYAFAITVSRSTN
ncbi:hypothetical protein Tco_0644123 [Tanacetum coccineum]